jgi:hypothetical protein
MWCHSNYAYTVVFRTDMYVWYMMAYCIRVTHAFTTRKRCDNIELRCRSDTLSKQDIDR